MELKQLFDFLINKFDVIDHKVDEFKNEMINKFDGMKHEMKQEFNKINDRLEIVVTKVSQLVVISETTSQTQPKPTFDDDKILREIELCEINDDDLLDEEELLRELGIFDIAAKKPSVVK